MPQYQITCHPTAKRELNDLPDDLRDHLTERITEAAGMAQPTQHRKAESLQGQDGLFRIRAENARAICTLEKPELRIIRCGKRRNVYDNIDDIDDRLEA